MSRPSPAPYQSDAFAQFDREQWLIRRLGELGAHVNDGLTDQATRCERIRQLIIGNSLEGTIAGRGTDRKPESFRQVFERLYGQPLITQTMKAAVDALRNR